MIAWELVCAKADKYIVKQNYHNNKIIAFVLLELYV